MKNTFVVLALTFSSLISFASSTCYVAKTAVPEGAPKAICLRDLEVDSAGGSVTLNTDLEDTVKKALQISSFVRHNEERAKFVAILHLQDFNDNFGCGEAAQVSATIAGSLNTTRTPAVDPEALTISVSYDHKNDVCHSPAQETILEYVLSK
ncbi:MAG: hypothetical protein H7256_02495 [Bdellovibrio sp.]|nr:hypothetical protein [Bdellovibrio sp.]